MGFYLNSKKPAILYGKEARAAYFVDKTPLLEDLGREFPGAEIDSETAVWDAMNQILELEDEVKFR